MTDRDNPPSRTESSSGDSVVGLAILGCLTAGVVALFKAFVAPTGADTFLCTAGAVLAFGTVIWMYCSKRL